MTLRQCCNCVRVYVTTPCLCQCQCLSHTVFYVDDVVLNVYWWPSTSTLNPRWLYLSLIYLSHSLSFFLTCWLCSGLQIGECCCCFSLFRIFLEKSCFVKTSELTVNTIAVEKFKIKCFNREHWILFVKDDLFLYYSLAKKFKPKFWMWICVLLL